MKKHIFIIIPFLVFVSFSCKNFTCHCETVNYGTSSTPSQQGSETTFFVKGPKNKATKSCKAYSNEEANLSKTECTLK